MTISKEETRKIYLERINRIVHHINTNLDKQLDMSMLAGLGHYSEFHFQKIMKAYLGESLGTYIIRLRLESAAHLLRASNQPVHEIALRSGYENPASFNKAFKKRFQMAPLDYRNMKQQETQIIHNQNIVNMHLHIPTKPKIKTIESKTVIYVQSTGPYSESASRAWTKVCDFAAKKKLFGWKTSFIGISHDSPDITEAEKLRYDACMTIRKTVIPEGEIGVKTIEGGRYAIFRHKGSYNHLNDSYQYIYSTWMAESGAEPDDKPCFEIYINSPDKVSPEKLITDIYIPIQ